METGIQRAPEHEQALVGDESSRTSWDLVRERLENHEKQQTSWLATVRADGRPHLMPVITFWFDGAFYFVAGEGTRKGRNLAADGQCVIGTSNLRLPSLDIVAEGRAEPVADAADLRRIVKDLSAGGWPLEVRGVELYGPHAPTAGPPPYRLYRMFPSKIIGLPGMHGMDEFDPADLPKPTRWEFAPLGQGGGS